MAPTQPVLSAEEVWHTWDAMERRLTAPLSERMLDLARLRAGMRVLDLATGRGEPAIPAAHRVGPSGSVLGIDVSKPMLELAGARAAREGVTNLELRATDATSLDSLSPGAFDAALIRWGLMYMVAPVAALAGVSRALKPEGLLVAALWAEPERVPYFSFPRRVLERFRPLPPVDSSLPGTFRYADLSQLHRDLQSAGLRVEHVEEIEVPVMEAETSAELIAWVRAFGLTRLLNELDESAQRAWEEVIAKEAEAFREGGVIRLGGVTRIVVASTSKTARASQV